MTTDGLAPLYTRKQVLRAALGERPSTLGNPDEKAVREPDQLPAAAKDSLGDRMKRQYEDRTRFLLPRRTYTIIRIDGKCFHSFTRNMAKPFDYDLMTDLDETAIALCEQAMGVEFAYLQSDEISFLLTDFATPQTEAWFDGNLQKIVSVSASIVTASFAQGADFHGEATFDARVFTIPDPVEVDNYFLWRQKDAERNSLQMVARVHYSHKELLGKSTAELHDMVVAAGDNWNDYPDKAKRGRIIVREITTTDGSDRPVVRHAWKSRPAPRFSQDRSFLRAMIPGFPWEKGNA